MDQCDAALFTNGYAINLNRDIKINIVYFITCAENGGIVDITYYPDSNIIFFRVKSWVNEYYNKTITNITVYHN